jgi:hypothetical protein
MSIGSEVCMGCLRDVHGEAGYVQPLLAYVRQRTEAAGYPGHSTPSTIRNRLNTF